MNSPLDVFPSEHAGPPASPEVTSEPGGDASERPQATPVRTQAEEPLQVRPSRPRVGPPPGAIVGYSRTFSGWQVVWRTRPEQAPASARYDTLATVAAAAAVSAGVTLLAVWLWGESDAPGDEAGTAASPYYDSISTTSRAQAGLAVVRQPSANPSVEQHVEGPLATKASAQAPSAPLDGTRAQPGAASPPRNTIVPPPAVPKASSTPAREPAAPTQPPPVKTAVSVVAPATAPAGAATGSGGGASDAARASGLVVITEPEGARVTINGVGYGKSPVTIPFLAPGAKRIRVTKEGYISEDRVLAADAATSGATLRIELRAAGAAPPQR